MTGKKENKQTKTRIKKEISPVYKGHCKVKHLKKKKKNQVASVSHGGGGEEVSGGQWEVAVCVPSRPLVRPIVCSYASTHKMRRKC